MSQSSAFQRAWREATGRSRQAIVKPPVISGQPLRKRVLAGLLGIPIHSSARHSPRQVTPSVMKSLARRKKTIPAQKWRSVLEASTGDEEHLELERNSSSTGQLCAAAYLDRNFRERVLDDVCDRPDLAVAPNPGVNPIEVVAHIRRARAMEHAQSTILVSIVLASLTLSSVNSGALAVGLLGWGLVGSLIIKNSLDSTKGRRNREKKKVKMWAPSPVGFFLAIFFADLFVAILTPIVFGSVPDKLRRPFEHVDPTSFLLSTTPLIAMMLVAGIFGLLRVRRIMSVSEPSRELRDDRDFGLEAAQRATISSYSESGRPFVGYGKEVGHWNFAVPLRLDSGQSFSEMDIDLVQLNRFIRDRILAIERNSLAAPYTPKFHLADQVLVPGKGIQSPVYDLRDVRSFGDPFTLESIQRGKNSPARYYLRCQASFSDGEIVATIFVHLAIQGRSLFTEYVCYVLPPTRASYHIFDKDYRPSKFSPVREVLHGIAAAPEDIARELTRTRLFKPSFRENTETVASIRELGTDLGEFDYLEAIDAVKYQQMMESQILDAIMEYLRERDFDVSEFKERSSTILNHGVMLRVGNHELSAPRFRGGLLDYER